MQKPAAEMKLTRESLQVLKELGFRYVLVKGYTPRRRFDFIELDRFTLVPVKELPEGPGEKEIYAPIDSEILLDWASGPDDGIQAYIEGYSLLVKK
jgi:hypothetical protein